MAGGITGYIKGDMMSKEGCPFTPCGGELSKKQVKSNDEKIKEWACEAIMVLTTLIPQLHNMQLKALINKFIAEGRELGLKESE